MACDFFGISEAKHIAVRRNTANFGGAGNFGLDWPDIDDEVGMAKQNSPVEEQEVRMGRRVNRRVSVLLTEIEKEEIPDRLLELARELQKALNGKTNGAD
ncbi:hypothetical protein EDE05_104304 [Neorhizobium sp. R1-B]|nr:hypothetical protein EDE09_103102 [Neorhizobium sp. S3-V5DH]TDX85720.1 hypothetical protein EDE05_104304 [Neorhizobium sp. R1-B]